MTRISPSILRAGILAAVALSLVAAPSDAQRRRAKRDAKPESLRGSKASVEKMYGFAQRHRYPFYLTPTNLDAAIAQKRLVALTGDSTYEITRGVGFSYATREVKQFVLQFAPQYLYACGTPLTVTSAARPLSNQPRNANAHSVHPAGIAVDIRRPYAGPCLTWVRSALADLEKRGLIEATEERHPAHLHIAVLVAPGVKVMIPNLVQGTVAAVRSPALSVQQVSYASSGEVSLPARTARTYVVRPGDTLTDIANKTGVTVRALAAENGRAATRVLQPGTTLKVPAAAR